MRCFVCASVLVVENEIESSMIYYISRWVLAIFGLYKGKFRKQTNRIISSPETLHLTAVDGSLRNSWNRLLNTTPLHDLIHFQRWLVVFELISDLRTTPFGSCGEMSCHQRHHFLSANGSSGWRHPTSICNCSEASVFWWLA